MSTCHLYKAAREEGLQLLFLIFIITFSNGLTSYCFVCLLALSFSLVLATDNNPLFDICVADPKGPVTASGPLCKDLKLVHENDFFFTGLHKPGNTSNPLGSKVTLLNAQQIPGLNSLGISFARIDFQPGGINPLHLHPRGSEILTVIEGTLEVGFVTSSPDYRLFTKVLQKGDVFVFPAGLVHYQKNPEHVPAVAYASLNSQNPGSILLANTAFGSTPKINTDILVKTFHLDKKVIRHGQQMF
ncbi:putative germin-like protein 2-1 [Pistacia vera]|uniref:putative germin-like protein 2-1 n=1 Tax=Pistacia vera TaxID=55513 RepID=UPI001263B886|nr:putative germin-like protein 2-1 [Pistacia vera]